MIEHLSCSTCKNRFKHPGEPCANCGMYNKRSSVLHYQKDCDDYLKFGACWMRKQKETIINQDTIFVRILKITENYVVLNCWSHYGTEALSPRMVPIADFTHDYQPIEGKLHVIK